MKRWMIIILVVLVATSGCAGQEGSFLEQRFVPLNDTLDIMMMTAYEDHLYLATNEGLYRMGQDKTIEEVALMKPLSLIHWLHVAKDGKLYVAGMNGLIVMDGPQDQSYYNVEASWLPDSRVLHVTEDEEGTLYIGTFGGLGILDPETMSGRTMTVEEGLLVPMVNRTVVTDDGTLWLASYNVRGGGITRVDEEGKVYHYTEVLATPHITSTLLEDKRLYFGGGVYDTGGLTLFEQVEDEWVITERFYEEDGFAGAKVRSLYQEEERLYIGSEYSGLAVWDRERKSIYTVEDGLPNNEVKCILRYREELLVGTRSGLCRMIE